MVFKRIYNKKRKLSLFSKKQTPKINFGGCFNLLVREYYRKSRFQESTRIINPGSCPEFSEFQGPP